MERNFWAAERDRASLERALDQKTLDYERLRQDFNSVVVMLSNQAIRPQGKSIFEDDPFREIPGDDTYLSPEEGSAIDVEQIEKDLNDAAA
jgi:hypothetical protein